MTQSPRGRMRAPYRRRRSRRRTPSPPNAYRGCAQPPRPRHRTRPQRLSAPCIARRRSARASRSCDPDAPTCRATPRRSSASTTGNRSGAPEQARRRPGAQRVEIRSCGHRSRWRFAPVRPDRSRHLPPAQSRNHREAVQEVTVTVTTQRAFPRKCDARIVGRQPSSISHVTDVVSSLALSARERVDMAFRSFTSPTVRSLAMAQSSIRDARRFGAPRRAKPGVSPSERHRFASVEGRGSVSPGRFDRRRADRLTARCQPRERVWRCSPVC